ncbi:MAG: LPS export ABC transporter periplasmic protein LptC [Treponema sp.]|nr:LPS export ABC transporter periplasmic protein LptC [Treponema sp.]
MCSRWARRGNPRLFLLISLLFFWGCSFDYGENSTDNENQPDLIMDKVAYARVRDGDHVARFEAERAERYEKRQTMELKQLSFEQFTRHGEEINAAGSAGTAFVELDSGNIHMGDTVRVAVDSEDITMQTATLDWKDKDRFLSGGETEPVDIQRSDGTTFTGYGFSADVRQRTWNFALGASGVYMHEDKEEEEKPDGEEDGYVE